MFTEHDHGVQHHEFYLRLDNNQLIAIPAYAFKNLSSINASNIYLHFENNRINYIDINAFNAIENNVTYLNLEHNALVHLPAALGKLSYLKYLLLLDNPLVSLDAIVFVSMSSTLRTLSMSLSYFNTLPHELHVLAALQSLTAHTITFPDWNSTVFQIFETSLTNLDISHSNFTSIPSAVCNLHSLQSLSVNYSPNLRTNTGNIFDRCAGKQMAFITHLSLKYNELTTIPNFGSLFPRLKTLDLMNNDLHFIGHRSIAGLPSLSTMYLSGNQFVRIPSEVYAAHNLQSLHLKYNLIRTIGRFDLLYNRNLTTLNLLGNPLEYISDNAFISNTYLNDINLHDTKLGKIPLALVRLPHLGTVYISGSPINCSCQSMSYLKSWNVGPVNLFASCAISGIPVKQFLVHDLPNCH